MRNGLEKWEKELVKHGLQGGAVVLVEKYTIQNQCYVTFFEKIFCQFKKRLYFCT